MHTKISKPYIYNKFSDHLKKKFGCRVYKIAIDAGLCCPNKNGIISNKGCIFCDSLGGSGRNFNKSNLSISEQISSGMSLLKAKYKAEKFITYFQTFTNTYGPLNILKKIYDEGVKHKDIIGLSIATRPDCIDEKILDLIECYSKKYYVWIELGVQSVHNRTLLYLNRGHGFFDIVNAISSIKQRNINVCTHIIIGLPGETTNDVVETARVISRLGIDAVKTHMLYVAKGTKLEGEYLKGNISLLNKEQYVFTVVKFIENLASNILIQRLVSEAHSDLIVAPNWLKNKFEVINLIESEIIKQDTYQGKEYEKISRF